MVYPNLASGSIPVEVRDVNGCIFSTSVTITNTSGPTAIATTVINATCGASNGSITLGAVTGGVAPYTYSVDGSPFTSTTSYTGLAAGSYPVVVRDANSCEFTTSATIANAGGPTAIATTVANATCGASNGSITIGAVTGGVAPYTYSVDGSPFTSTTSYTGLAAGSYPVVVRDANSCEFTTSATINNTGGPTAIVTTVVNATCGASNGSITIGAVTGGVAPYTYSVDGSPFTSTTSYTGLAAGSYPVVVRDANSCEFTTSATIANTGGPTAIVTTVGNATCGASNGSIILGAVTGGVAPYTYSVDGSPFTSTTSYTGLAAGSYPVVVRDANSCEFTTSATINNTGGPTAIVTTVVNATCGASNGSITIGAVTGGLAPYTYSVNGSPFTSTTSYTALAAGTYPVVVRDANSCEFSTSATIANTGGPTAIATTLANATCGTSNGSITLGTVTGGVAPYTYSVDGSPFTSTTSYTGLAAATYPVIVRDANSCEFSTSATIANTGGPTAIATTVVNAACGASNGSITLGAVTGGVAPYTYSVDGSPFTSTTSYTGLAAATYPVVVRDANSCEFTTSATIANTGGPTAIATTLANATCGTSNGSITLGTVTGGVAPYTYSVDGSPFTSTTSYTGLAAATYPVIVRDANSCEFTTSATIANTGGPTAIVTTVANAACGASNGSITLGAVTGGVAPFTYSVDGSPFTSTTSYTGLAAATYPVVVRDANSCEFTTSATIANTGGPTAIVTTVANAACGASNGSITLGAVTGGVAPFTYSVDGSPFTSTTSYTGLAAGTYPVIVRDANSCEFTTSATIANTGGPTAIVTTVANAACGASNGSITLGAVTGGVAPFTYSVDGSPFTSTTSYTGLAAATYPVIVRDANSCEFSTSATIANTGGPTAIATTVANATCGASNGSITLGAVTGGVAPYTYSVNGSAFTSTTSYTTLAAGTYPVVVRDANSCEFTTSATIANTGGPSAIVTTIANATCGTSNGSITLGAVTGGLAPYTYSVNGSAFTSTTSYTGLAAGTYPVVVRDANSCEFTTSATIVNTGGPTAIATTVANATCGTSNGSITLGAVTGGLAPYTYSVNGSAFTSTTSYTGLTAGTYPVVVRDANSCEFTTSSTIVNTGGPTAIATTVANATCGASNGSITLGTVTGGLAPYTYSVDGSAFTSNTSYTGLAAGTYPVVVRDANTCEFTTSVTITDASGPTAIATTVANTTCGASNGSITLGAVTGGVAPYTYSVDGSAFTPILVYTNLPAASYSIVIRDANSCEFSTSATITDASGPTAISTTIVNEACGTSNGSITLGAVTGGVAPYTYSVNGSAFTSTTSYSSLAAGTYSVVVRDANSCEFSTSATITNTSGPTALTTTVVNAACGTSNGSITVATVTGGAAPYTYSVDGSPFTATTSYTSLAAGTYAVEVMDANGCIFSTTESISNTGGPTDIASTVTNTTCGASNGSITLGAVTGGVAPYTYSVDGSPFTSTTNYTSLAAGTIAVEVMDANGCIFSTSVIITDASGPSAIVTNITSATCGTSNGSITLGAVTGGLAPYTYSVNGSLFTSTTSYTSLAAGSYPVVVRDANSCEFTTSATILDASGPSAIVTNITSASCGASNGTLTLGAVTGGVAPYTYSVNGSAFTSTTSYTGLAAGTYPVVVRDANSCEFSTSVTITNSSGPTAIVTSVANASCGAPNGSITIGAVTGGVAPYTYSVDGSAFTSTTSYTGLAAGTYPVIVRDANGCEFTTSATIANTGGPTAIVTTVVNAACGASNGSITLGAVTGGVAPYTYSVNGSAFTSTTSYTGLAAGTYPVVVRDANSCEFTTSATIANTGGPTAIVTTVVNAACGASNGSITLGAVTGGLAPYTYSVNGSAFTSTTSYTTLAAGTYPVVVRDANSCEFTTSATIANTGGPTAIVTTVVNAACGASNGSITLGAVTGGVAPYTYSVNGSAFTSTTSYTTLAAGTYPVVVRDANSCEFTTSATIANTGGPTAIVTTVVNAACGASNGSINPWSCYRRRRTIYIFSKW